MARFTFSLQFAQQIAATMNGAKVKAKRDAKQVLSKIEHIEKQFRKAYDFAQTETGAGLLEDGTFTDAVEKICPYYFDLFDIMSDRAAAKPKALSDEMSDDDNEVPDDLLGSTGSHGTSSSSSNDDCSSAELATAKRSTVVTKRNGAPPVTIIDRDAMGAPCKVSSSVP